MPEHQTIEWKESWHADTQIAGSRFKERGD